jgi:hypothetical protein
VEFVLEVERRLVSAIFEATLRAAGTCLPPCEPRLPLDRRRRPSALMLLVFSSRGVPKYWLRGVASVSVWLVMATRNKLQYDRV